MADENESSQKKEHFPEDTGTHTPPQGEHRDTTESAHGADEPRKMPAGAGTAQNRRSFAALVVGAIVIIIVLALIFAL